MPLTSDQQRKVRLHLKVLQTNRTGQYVGGVFETLEAATILQYAMDNLTADGVTTVTEQLTNLDTMRTEMVAARTRMQASEVRDIKLRADEFAARQEQYAYFVRELAATLDVTALLDAAQAGGGGAQGPWREP